MLPALIAILLLLTELGLSTAAATYEAPIARLAGLMDRVGQGQVIARSGRHDRSEIGMALLRFNGILHRLADRAQRVLALADEVQRAVFDAGIAGQVSRRASALRTSAARPLLDPAVSSPDSRSSDIHLSLTLLFAGGSFGLVATYGAAPGIVPIWPLAGTLLGGLLAALLRSPGWGLVLAGVVQIAAALLGPLALGAAWSWPAVAAGLAAGVGAALVASWLFMHRSQGFGLLWIVLRCGLGSLAGGLLAWTVVLEGRLAVAPVVVLVAVGLAVAAANRAAVVRARLFERSVRAG